MLEKLNRKGSITQEDGTLVLVDDNHKGYKVDNVVAVIWTKCNNKTIEEVADEISKELQDLDKNSITEAVKVIVQDLKNVHLVE